MITAGYREFHIIDPSDDWLEKRIKSATANVLLNWYDPPVFLNSRKDLSGFFKPWKKKYFQTSFYKQQREKRGMLMERGEPKGGKWTYDTENRKK